MVVFTCNNCGDSLQKPKVDKHYQTVCRTNKNLTCVDCFKDFRGEEYVAHIKCITEEERYAAKGSMPNGVVKKGEVKQQTWTDMIRSIIEKEVNLSVGLRNMLNIVGGYVNVPRKKVKFINFITNSFGRNYRREDIETIWDLIEKHKTEQYPSKKEETKVETNMEKENDESTKTATSPEKENGDSTKSTKRKAESNNNKETENDQAPTKKAKKSKKNVENAETNNNKENGVNGNNENTTEVKKKKKSKKNSENTESNNVKENGVNGKDENTTEITKFSYENQILEILNSKKQITLKKLQKKVLSAYTTHHGLEEHTEKQVKKFNQKLKKMPNIEIKDDLVTLT